MFTNKKRTRRYGFRIGDIVSYKHKKGEYVVINYPPMDNNRLSIQKDGENPINVVAEWCKMDTRVENRELTLKQSIEISVRWNMDKIKAIHVFIDDGVNFNNHYYSKKSNENNDFEKFIFKVGQINNIRELDEIRGHIWLDDGAVLGFDNETYLFEQIAPNIFF